MMLTLESLDKNDDNGDKDESDNEKAIVFLLHLKNIEWE